MTARNAVLVRRRPLEGAEPSGDVHLIPLPLSSGESVAIAICGAQLRPTEMETVSPGEGVWCTMCFVSHVTGSQPERTTPPDQDPRRSAGLAYRELGWPVTLRGADVSLNLDLDLDAVAFVLPAVLATAMVEILHRRHCRPPVLVHPALPARRIVLAGERFPVPLGWPTGVHRVTGTLVLPPTVTAHGQVRWVHPPRPNALRLCREVDVIAALRAALQDPPPAPTQL